MYVHNICVYKTDYKHICLDQKAFKTIKNKFSQVSKIQHRKHIEKSKHTLEIHFTAHTLP